MKTVEPCGTRAAYMRHRRHGEDPCTPCIHAQSAYIRQYRRSRPKKVAYPTVDPNAYEVDMAAALANNEPVIVWRKNNHGIWVHTSIHDPYPDSGHNATRTEVAQSRSLAGEPHAEFPVTGDRRKVLKGEAA